MKKLNAGHGYMPEKRDLRCSLKCLEYKANAKWGVSRYSDGQKFCKVCKIFIRFTGDDCPCCKEPLRKKRK